MTPAPSLRSTARWMCLLDDRLLEIADADGWVGPESAVSRPVIAEIATASRVRVRCHVLAHAGFLAPLGPDDAAAEHFVLNQKGREYLDGELAAEHHAPPARAFEEAKRASEWASRV